MYYIPEYNVSRVPHSPVHVHTENTGKDEHIKQACYVNSEVCNTSVKEENIIEEILWQGIAGINVNIVVKFTTSLHRRYYTKEKIPTNSCSVVW